MNRVEAPRGTMGRLVVLTAIAAATQAAVGCSRGSNASPSGGSGPIASSPAVPGPSADPAPTPAPTPPPNVPPPPAQPPASTSSSLRLAADGLYLLDPPLAGEPVIQGDVEVVVEGKAPPADTVVELNGVALAREGRGDDADRFWHVDAAAPQPPLRADGTITIAARTGSLWGAVALACPPDIAVSTSTAAGASLSASPSLALTWASALPMNPVVAFGVATLRGLDVATSTPSPVVLAQQLLTGATLQAALPVESTSSSGYVAELRWPGSFITNGNAGGSCGRVKRIIFSR